MNITDVAELLSALAAFLTVALAFVELFSRSRIKKADTAIDIYADFLHLVQQLQFAQRTAATFAEKCTALSPTERISYAKTHIITPETLTLMQKFEKDCISNFDYTSDVGKTNSSAILEFTSAATSFAVSVNTYYQFILDGKDYSTELIRAHRKNVDLSYDKLNSSLETAGELLRRNLKKTHNTSTLYLIVLLSCAAVFTALCFFL